jgi:hypothetical protein
MQDAGCRMQDAGCWCRMQDAGAGCGTRYVILIFLGRISGRDTRDKEYSEFTQNFIQHESQSAPA